MMLDLTIILLRVLWLDSTVVSLSTRPVPLIISKTLQFRTFWPQRKLFFMIRYMLSVGSWSKTFGALKWQFYVNFLNFQYIKSTIFYIFLHNNGQCQVTFFLKIYHSKFSCSCKKIQKWCINYNKYERISPKVR